MTKSVLVYDGDCGFCTSSARWVSRRLPPGASATPWQRLGPDGLNTVGLTVEQAKASAWWVDADGTAVSGHRAIGRSLQSCGGWRRRAGTIVLHPLLSRPAAAVYHLVSENRHRLPGGTPACRDDRS